MTSDEAQPNGVRQKRIASNTRVSGKFGEFIEDGTDGKRRKRARIYGTVIEAVDSKRYKVCFDNGSTQNCYSNSLRVESNSILPPDLPPLPLHPVVRTDDGPPAEHEDDASEEHLPEVGPGDDEISVTRDDDAIDMPMDDIQHELPVDALPAVIDEPEAPSYHRRKEDAKQRIRAMFGRTVREKSKNQSILWTVIGDHVPVSPLEEEAADRIGFKDIDSIRSVPKNLILAKLFLELMFIDTTHIKELVQKMNFAIKSGRDSKVKLFTPEEFVMCLGVFIGSAEFESQGKKCWQNVDHKSGDDDDFHSLVQHANFDRYIAYHRFKECRRYYPSIWYNEQKREAKDPWWQFSDAVDNFNSIRGKKLYKSTWAVIDESMSSWRPRTTKLGGLPNLSHVPRKPEPLGTEFKCTADPKSGCLLALEIQRGKEGNKNLQFNNEIGNTAGGTTRLMNITNSDGNCIGVKGDAWFGSVRSCTSLMQKGYESILQIKQQASLFPKDIINEALKNAPGGVHISLSGSFNNVDLIATGYRYSRKTILFFIMTANAGSCLHGIPYDMKYTDPYGNLCIRNVDRPDFISRFFADSNTIDSHNHVRQSELGLEKKWHTKDPYFSLNTSLIGMCVADAWKLPTLHRIINNKKDSNEDQRMGIKKFAGSLALQLLNCASSLLSDEPNPVLSDCVLLLYHVII